MLSVNDLFYCKYLKNIDFLILYVIIMLVKGGNMRIKLTKVTNNPGVTNLSNEVVFDNGQISDEDKRNLSSIVFDINSKNLSSIVVQSETVAVGLNGELNKAIVEHPLVFGKIDYLDISDKNQNDSNNIDMLTKVFTIPVVKDIKGNVMKNIDPHAVTVFDSLEQFSTIVSNIIESSKINLEDVYSNNIGNRHVK